MFSSTVNVHTQCDFHDVAGVKAAFLQERWRMNGEEYQTYGDCRSGNCCLFYDFTASGFKGDRSCRHWLYYTSGRVYNDFVVNAGDYRLMLALHNHKEAVGVVKALQSRNEGTRKPLLLRVLGLTSLSASMDTMCVSTSHEKRILQYPYVVVESIMNNPISAFTLTVSCQAGFLPYNMNNRRTNDRYLCTPDLCLSNAIQGSLVRVLYF